MNPSIYRRFGKRAIDFGAACLALTLLSPLLISIAVLIRFSSPGPVMFVQKRLGKDGKTFNVLKFRTMTHRERESNTEILADNPEVTPVGKVLRRFKIDEVPQLVNVLRGDMSFIGPRPALPQQLSEYDETGRMRLTVRPGLTGLAQVNGNIYLSWPERWKFDAEYVRRLSLLLDAQILAKTVLVVILGEHRFIRER